MKEIKRLKKENKKLRDALYEQEHEIQQLHIECNERKRRIINQTAMVKDHQKQLQDITRIATFWRGKYESLNKLFLPYLIITVIINVIIIIANLI